MGDKWVETSIGDVTELLTGFPFKSELYTDAADGIRLVRGDNVVQGKFRWDGVKRWLPTEARGLEAYFLNVDDVILAMDRTWVEAGLKYASVSLNDLPCLLVQRVARLRAKNGINQRYLKYVIASPQFTSYILGIQMGTAVPHISPGQIKGFKFILPPVENQRAIAAILATWDRAIEQTTRLIEAKRRLKQGLMQQLLAGKRRLSGLFSTSWGTVRLGNVFVERVETNRGDLPLLSITADRGVVSREDVEKRDTSSADKKMYKRIASGDIGYNTMRMWQGVSALSPMEGIISPAYTVCIPQVGILGPFAKHLLKFPPLVHQLFRHSQGLVDDTLNLKFPHFAKIEVNLPGVEEQRRIAEMLGTGDNEIELLSKRLDAIKLQKKALMQKLLTGQVRAKVEVE